MAVDPTPDGQRLTSLPLATVVAVLRKAGATRIDADTVRAHVAAGAPANLDGSINLIAYGAWLIQELARRGRHGA